MDSNHRAFYRRDLQSRAFNHSATYPNLIPPIVFVCAPFAKFSIPLFLFGAMVPRHHIFVDFISTVTPIVASQAALRAMLARNCFSVLGALAIRATLHAVSGNVDQFTVIYMAIIMSIHQYQPLPSLLASISCLLISSLHPASELAFCSSAILLSAAASA